MAQSAPEAAAAQAAENRLTDVDVPMTYDEHVARLASGMEAAMHLILCLRNVYSPGAYTSSTHRTRSGPGGTGGSATYTAYTPIHPGLQAYFSRVREALQTQLTHQDVAAVALLLHFPQSGKVLERYVFRLAYAWPRAPPAHERSVPIISAGSTAEFEYKFAGLMGKLTASLATLSPLPAGEGAEELSCAVVLQLQDPSARPSAHEAGTRLDPHQPPEGAWVPLDPSLTRNLPRPRTPGEPSTSSPSARQAEIVPVQSLASGVIDLTFYVEDHKVAKAHARRHAGRGRRREG